MKVIPSFAQQIGGVLVLMSACLSSFRTIVMCNIQGDHGGHRLGYVDFYLVVPACPILLWQLQIGQKCHSSWARLWNIMNKVNKT